MPPIRNPLRKHSRARKLWIRFVVVLFTIFVITYSVQVVLTFIGSSPSNGRLNYFLEGDEHLKLGYIVNTPACRILNISAWDKAVLPFLSNGSSATNCHKYREWTYTENTNLIINVTALSESGYSLNSVSCCYMTIQRVNQSPDNYNEYADLKIAYSKTCKPMQVVNPVKDEFIRVICSSKYWPWSMDVVYRNFHAVPLPTKSSNTTKKVFYWKSATGNVTQRVNENAVGKVDNIQNVYSSTSTKNKNLIPSQLLSSSSSLENGINKQSTKSSTKLNKNNLPKTNPPNVILVGIDSMSRLSFQRNMKKTRRFLQQIGAVEMLGYTKVGENTFPNAMAFITGYQTQDLTKICYFSGNTRLDLCPFIWKKFDEANYLTALIEDVPLLATYNYLKTGFVEQPVDYYFRPFMLGVHYHSPSLTFALDCIGGKSVDETVLKYLGDMMSMSSQNHTPLFMYTWLTNLAHGDMNAAQFADDVYLQFFKGLDLSNTIMFFMSDHGYRYGAFRETFAGWQEDKLPNFWVYLPENVKQEFPTWLPTIQQNSVRLTTPLDLYKTLVHILTSFTNVDNFTDSKSFNGELISRKFGQTLFEEVPRNRKCPEAGVSENLCACVAPKRVETNNNNIIAATAKAIGHINQQLPKVCSPLSLRKITAGGIMDDPEHQGDARNITLATYVVAFETNPGEFLFEATVEFNVRLQSYTVVGELLRMNKITTDVSCIKNDLLEKICFCQSS